MTIHDPARAEHSSRYDLHISKAALDVAGPVYASSSIENTILFVLKAAG